MITITVHGSDIQIEVHLDALLQTILALLQAGHTKMQITKKP